MKSTRYEKEAVLSYRENIQEHSLAVSLAILAACDEQHYWKRKTRAEEPIIISSREREERVCGGPAGYHRWRAGCRQQIMEASHHVSTRIVRTFRFAAAGVDRVNHSTWLVDHLRSTRRPPAPLEIRSYGVPSYVESTERPPAHRPLRTSFMEASIDADSKISAAHHIFYHSARFGLVVNVADMSARLNVADFADIVCWADDTPNTTNK